MSLSSRRYNNRARGGQHGDVYTLPVVVSFMLDEVGYVSSRDLSHISIFEPSCGEGEFVVEIANRLYLSSVSFGFDFVEAFKANVYASDIDGDKMEICKKKLIQKFGLSNDAFINFYTEDFLLSKHGKVDIVIGNPPYIRYEEIPTEKVPAYKSAFYSFYYRADMYVFFYEKSLSILKRGGRHCFICSDRWLKNTYGARLRNLIAKAYCLEKIIDMEDVCAFQENVLAYPSITLISNAEPQSTVEYTKVKDVCELGHSAFCKLGMPCDGDWTNMFIKKEFSHLRTIEEQGFHIGIGVATGNDSLYVSNGFKGLIEDDLLLPCINAQNLRGNELKWDGRYLLSPYDKKGNLIELSRYPKARKYLEDNFAVLSKRQKARKNPARWYATIDKISWRLLDMPKVLLPDISGNKYIFVDEGHFYPQHNIYYITNGNIKELGLIAALLMSKPIRTQLDAVANHMNGGYARWQVQYLKKLRLPVISDISEDCVQKLLKAYERKQYDYINTLAQCAISEQETKSQAKNISKTVRMQTLNFEYT